MRVSDRFIALGGYCVALDRCAGDAAECRNNYCACRADYYVRNDKCCK